jgi:lipopolysaccharide transport system ATP-binding protein
MPAISAHNIGKRYLLHEGHNRGKSTLVATLSNMAKDGVKKLCGKANLPVKEKENSDFWALSELNFTIEEGDRLGIIGRNGAGKSTLLKILSRIILPTEGRIEVQGKVASLLEIGTGFHPELTGRENIFLNGAILGMSMADIRKRFDEIVAFSEIERFLDLPVKHFSTGMYTRLGFSVAAHLNPDILIVDEVLAVGDILFQEKCIKKLNELGKKGRTVLFVSHDMGSVLTLCNKGIYLEKGQIKRFGDVADCVSDYLLSMESLPIDWRGNVGDENIRFTRMAFQVSDPTKSYFVQNERPNLLIEYEVKKANPNLLIGFSILNLRHQKVARAHIGDNIDKMKPYITPGVHRLTFPIDISLLNEGEYMVRLECVLHTIKPILGDELFIRFSVLPDGSIQRLPHIGEPSSASTSAEARWRGLRFERSSWPRSFLATLR